MSYPDYPRDSYPRTSFADRSYGRRSPGLFAVVLTSIITSAAMTLIMLFVTGNLHISLNKAPAPSVDPAPPLKQVPPLIGLPTESAKDLLRAHSLRMVVKAEQHDKSVAKGAIIEQAPLPDSDLESGGEVAVVVSLGPVQVVVPPLVGKSLDDAKAAAKAAGVEIGEISNTQTGEPGTVTEVTPQAGASIEPGAKIALVVALESVEVPDLMGMHTSGAQKRIKKAGLKVGKISWRYNENRPANVVLGQKPEGGTKAAAGSEVNLVLNEE